MAVSSLKEHLFFILKKYHLISVTEILKILQKKGHHYNKTSVYRALQQLVDQQIVCQHFFVEAQALYELQADHHVHLFCASKCDYHQPDEVEGFKVDHHHLTLVGECQSCSKQNLTN
jgi:Fe2+ or Zn2+ uptake regulation protein